MPGLKSLFSPSSVAVVGASKIEGKIGYTILKNIIESGYNGTLLPVNPGEESILGLKTFPSLLEIEIPPELAVVAVPAGAVNKVARDAAACGVKYMVVISAGFKETGKDGKEKEKELLRICHDGGVRLLGPNCVGVIDTHTPLNASFSAAFPARGRIAFISQSGALLLSILDWSLQSGLGFSRFVSLGNKSDLNEADFIAAAADDHYTSVILCYLEDVADGPIFLETVKKAALKKPLIILKSGASQSGARAASSHTGALVGSDLSYEVAFKQCGALRARTIEELFDLADAFSRHPVPGGSRVAVITNAGGPGIIAADLVEKKGLEMAGFKKETVDALLQGLPPEAGIYNPVDVLGDAKADRFELALDIVLEDEGVDSAVVLVCPTATVEPSKTAEALVKAQAKYSHKPVFTSFLGSIGLQKGAEILNRAGMPHYVFPERAVNALKGMMSYGSLRKKYEKEKEPLLFTNIDKNAVKAVLYDVIKDHRVVLLGSEASTLVEAYGIESVPIKLTRDTIEAVNFAEEIGYPVVLKVASPEIQHKSDVGGVKVGLRNESEVETGFMDIMNRAKKYFPELNLYGVEIQKMAPAGHEVIVGMSKDLQFGPLLAFGMGGIYVNLIRDASFLLARELSISDIKEMIYETKAYILLRGYRGADPADVEAVVEIIGRLACLCRDFPEIAELDLNPVFVYEKGASVVDIKVTIESL